VVQNRREPRDVIPRQGGYYAVTHRVDLFWPEVCHSQQSIDMTEANERNTKPSIHCM